MGAFGDRAVALIGGGTGTPKLLQGVADDDLTVVANTGDDVEFGDLFVCPDVDACLFTLAGVIDREHWWGIEGDGTAVHDRLTDLAAALDLDGSPRFRPAAAQTAGRPLARWRRFEALPEFMTFGDRDRAIHRARGVALDRGRRLTAITRDLGDHLGASVAVLPMSDDPVATLVETDDGRMHFQEFWVHRRGEPTIRDVSFRGVDEAEPTPEVAAALAGDLVVIGPSNPVTSIGPVLELAGVRERLRETTVVAVSPFLGEDAFSGPAAALMDAVGLPRGTAGLTAAYPFLDGLVLDTEDGTDVDIETLATDVAIDGPDDARRVRAAVAALADRLGV